MDRKDLTDQSGLYRLLGELSADMKHVLRSLEANRNDTAKLRDEMREENEELKERLTKVEKFNVKVLAYASVAIPILLAVMKWAVPALLALL
ncbi:hypothetical protein ParaMal1_00008 [Paracoccus phage ParMal1]|uniref:Uncharacterized protein n=1 Tax=Paracoccus phage ParMal1 TaxID=3032416 RepID=A0AAF0FHX7_9CAUD|nr:hypothetical protein ParaMal1_00008 [Paracoccus phage ParMal1]